MRVLVVEDSVDSAETLGELITLWGHEVQLAHDGATALTIAREFRPAGDPPRHRAAGHGRIRGGRSPPGEDLGGEILVALTGYGEAQDRARAQQAGFDRHLTKPVEPGDLHELLRTAGPVSASGSGLGATGRA